MFQSFRKKRVRLPAHSITMIKNLLFLIAFTSLSSDAFRSQIAQISQSAQGRVGVAILVLETGKSADFSGDQQFPMQSVYKLPIGMAVLKAVDGGKVNLEQMVRVEQSDLVPAALHSPIRDKYPKRGVNLSVRELLRLMVAESDGTACDVLLRTVVGPDQVTSYLHGLSTKPDTAVAPDDRDHHRATPDQRASPYRNNRRP
jgi:beta-lactamase class A